jgi:phosphoribosyl 1,2-cyclic phosphodiesterase
MLKKIILTHFHTDHAGGSHHFPDSDIYVSGKDYTLAKGIVGRLLGYMPQRWPSWFRPIAIPFNKENFGPFEKSYRITSSGDVFVIPTPRHTPNHISAIVKSENILYFLAGDTTYSEELLVKNIPKWNYYVLDVKKITEGSIKVGTRLHQTGKIDNLSFKIIEYEDGKRVTIQTLPNSSPTFEMTYSFDPVETGFRQTCMN